MLLMTGALVALPAFAYAHSPTPRFGDFYGGILHPLTALEHTFAVIALGLLAGQQGRRGARWAALLFPLGLLAGALAALGQDATPAVSLINRASFVVLGVLVAVGRPLPLPLLGAICLFFGATHGFENVAGLDVLVARHLFITGIFVAGVCATLILSAVALTMHRPWQKIAVRVAGSWVFAIGTLLLALA